MIDVAARQENLAVTGEPIMLQLLLVPCYVRRSFFFSSPHAHRAVRSHALPSLLVVCDALARPRRSPCTRPRPARKLMGWGLVLGRSGSGQALSIRRLVLGSLEGVFAVGHVYVLVSRVVDPSNFALVPRTTKM